MSKQGQRFRAVKDDVTQPTFFKIVQSQTFKQDEFVLQNLDNFINNHPSNTLHSGNPELSSADISYGGINPTVLSQLNRLQRSLRGLPPLFEDESVPANTVSNSAEFNTIESTEKVNTKIVFED